jgi:hypothetical protein
MAILVGVTPICTLTVAFAEPLFFDCHGTYEFEHGMKAKVPLQIMIDPERGIVDAPFGGNNDYCSQEGDWQSAAVGPGVRIFFKIVRGCLTLSVTETAYSFYSTVEGLLKSVQLSDGQSRGERRDQSRGQGTLNRITGELHAEWRTEAPNGGKPEYQQWNMTCVPAQPKF